MSAQTFFVTQDGPANALALNKDHTQVVIAGRNGNFNLNFVNQTSAHYLKTLKFTNIENIN